VPDEPKSDEETVPAWLLEKTFCVEYCPNCPKRWLVRMPGKSAVIDKLPYRSSYIRGEARPPLTKDALGFGDTLEEAALIALNQQGVLKRQ
jgi:hypothetical protein